MHRNRNTTTKKEIKVNKKISAVVTLVGLILIMCAMAVFVFTTKKRKTIWHKKSSNTVLSSLKEKNRRKQFKKLRRRKKI